MFSPDATQNPVPVAFQWYFLFSVILSGQDWGKQFEAAGTASYLLTFLVFHALPFFTAQ